MSDWPWHAAHVVLTALVAIYSWVASSRRARADEVKAFERRLDGQSKKLTQLEERMAHLPSADTSAQLLAATRETAAKLGGIETRLDRIERRFDRYEEHALEAGR